MQENNRAINTVKAQIFLKNMGDVIEFSFLYVFAYSLSALVSIFPDFLYIKCYTVYRIIMIGFNIVSVKERYAL